MNKETINKYLNALYLKSKNDLRTGCSTEVLAGLLTLDNNTSQNILHYLAGKGFIDTKNNYGDNVSLTPEGFDFIETLREGKKYNVIKFYESLYVPPASVMRFGFLFWYEFINESGKVEHKTVGAFASDILSMTWRLRFDETGIKNSEKILLQFAKEHIITKISEGSLAENEEFTLMTSSQPQSCPYNPVNLVETKFAEFEIEIPQKQSTIQKSKVIEETPTEIISEDPTVFISYSWDDELHKDWVLNLTKRLFDKGINVLLDRLELGPGKNMIHFMESSIPKSSKVLIIFTPNYKLKAEKRQGGVGFEYSILNAELYTQITSNEKYIPILKAGNFSESIPAFMQQFIALDMTSQDNFEEKFTELVYAIYDKPQIEKPITGNNPFKNETKQPVQETTVELLKELKDKTKYLWTGLKEFKGGNGNVTEEIKESTFNGVKNSLDALHLKGLLTYEKNFLYEMITTKEKVYSIVLSNISTQIKNFVNLIEAGQL